MAISAISGNHPIISWSAVSGATQYKVYRANSATWRYAYSLLGTTTSASWTDNTYTASLVQDLHFQQIIIELQLWMVI